MTLTQLLDELLENISKVNPRLPNYLQPGLTREQMQSIKPRLPPYLKPGSIEERNVQLAYDKKWFPSEEVYTLYSWHNGLPDPPVGVEAAFAKEKALDEEDPSQKVHLALLPWSSFNSFQYAFIVDLDLRDSFIQREKECPGSLPKEAFSGVYIEIVGGSDGSHYIPCGETLLASAPVIFEDVEITEPVMRYNSLFDMMRTINECYKRGAYFFNEEIGIVDEGDDLVEQIHQELNPGLLYYSKD